MSYIHIEILLLAIFSDPQVRVVVMVVFLINFHTWGMNSVSCHRMSPCQGL